MIAQRLVFWGQYFDETPMGSLAMGAPTGGAG